jgi:two-component system chemotaxis response regulator CheY
MGDQPSYLGGGVSNYDLSKLRVLIIEDNAFTLDILRTIVRQLGVANIQGCEDGADALKRVAAQTFELLFVDWQIPSLDGCALVKAIRGLPNKVRSETPIIMITASRDKATVTKAREAGVDGYLVKPVSAQMIYDRVAAVIERGRIDLAAASD